MQLPTCSRLKACACALSVATLAAFAPLGIAGWSPESTSHVLAAEAPDSPVAPLEEPAAGATTSGSPATEAKPSTQPAAPDSQVKEATVGDAAVAIVNGYVITERQLFDILLDLAGKSVLDQLITETLIEQQAKAAGVTVTDEEVAVRMKQIRVRFATDAEFQQALQQAGLTERLLWRQLYFDELIVRLLAPLTQVTDADVQAYYEDHKAEYGEPAQVRARHILVKTREEAEAIRAELAKGADFAELARTRSLDKGSANDGGELGFFTADDVVPEFAAAAFSLESGEISDPVETDYGFHIIEVEERKEAKPATFEEVAQLIRETLMDDRLQQLVPMWLTQIRSEADIQVLWP